VVQAARRGVVALVMLFAGGCTGAAPAAQPAGVPVTIGLLAPASSAAAHGAQLAVDVVNGLVPEAPSPLVAALSERRGPMALVVAAPGATGAEAQQAVTRLVTQDKAAGIVLADPRRVVEAAERADGHQVPLVDASSSAVRLNDLGFDWYFRTAPSDRMLAAAALATLVPERRAGSPPRLAIVAAASATQANGTATLLHELSAGSGVAHVVTVATGTGPDGPGRTGSELARAEPDVVVAVAPDADAARTQLQAAAWLSSHVRLLGLGSGFAGGVALDEQHPYLLRAASWSAEFANRQPVAREVALLYRARFGEPMSEPAASAFTAAMTLATAINAAGTTRAGEVRGALHQLWLPATQTIMPWDGVRFGPGGQNVLASGVVEQRVGKTFRVVYPPELAIAPPKLPPLSG